MSHRERDRQGDADRCRGLYGKYRVERTDGRDKGPYFVLAYTTDKHAKTALAAYADSCANDYPQLAADLRAALATAVAADTDLPKKSVA